MIFDIYTFRSKIQAGILRGGFKDIKDIINAQIISLQTKADQLNAELVQLLKSESDLAASIKKLEESTDDEESAAKLQRAKQQYSVVSLRKREIMNNLMQHEQDIKKKQKLRDQQS